MTVGWHPHFGDIAGKTLEQWLAGRPANIRPQRSIFLATSERTGSEWLCQLLGGTGQLGVPSEYFNTDWNRSYISDYPDDVQHQKIIAHRVGTTKNGVFSAKMHPWHFERVFRRVTFDSLFPNPVFVHLFRLDRLGQAISLYRARHSQSYHGFSAPKSVVEFNAQAIARTVGELEAAESRWRIYFLKNNITPLAVSYEELTADPASVVKRIAVHSDISLGASPFNVERSLDIQRDDTTIEWRRQFLQEYGNMNVMDLPNAE